MRVFVCLLGCVLAAQNQNGQEKTPPYFTQEITEQPECSNWLISLLLSERRAEGLNYRVARFRTSLRADICIYPSRLVTYPDQAGRWVCSCMCVCVCVCASFCSPVPKQITEVTGWGDTLWSKGIV